MRRVRIFQYTADEMETLRERQSPTVNSINLQAVTSMPLNRNDRRTFDCSPDMTLVEFAGKVTELTGVDPARVLVHNAASDFYRGSGHFSMYGASLPVDFSSVPQDELLLIPSTVGENLTHLVAQAITNAEPPAAHAARYHGECQALISKARREHQLLVERASQMKAILDEPSEFSELIAANPELKLRGEGDYDRWISVVERVAGGDIVFECRLGEWCEKQRKAEQWRAAVERGEIQEPGEFDPSVVELPPSPESGATWAKRLVAAAVTMKSLGVHRAVMSWIAQQMALLTLPIASCLPKSLDPPKSGAFPVHQIGPDQTGFLNGLAAAMVVYDTPDGLPAGCKPMEVTVSSTISGPEARQHTLTVNARVQIGQLVQLVLAAEGQRLPLDRYGPRCTMSVDGVANEIDPFQAGTDAPTLGSLGLTQGSLVHLKIDHDAPPRPRPVMGRYPVC